MRTDDFDYQLPEERIAQAPALIRDQCKLLVMDRETGQVEDRVFRDIIDYLEPGDVLVANETRVMPARLLGAKRGTGGAACRVSLITADPTVGLGIKQFGGTFATMYGSA